jgi:hypothetical protein
MSQDNWTPEVELILASSYSGKTTFLKEELALIEYDTDDYIWIDVPLYSRPPHDKNCCVFVDGDDLVRLYFIDRLKPGMVGFSSFYWNSLVLQSVSKLQYNIDKTSHNWRISSIYVLVAGYATGLPATIGYVDVGLSTILSNFDKSERRDYVTKHELLSKVYSDMVRDFHSFSFLHPDARSFASFKDMEERLVAISKAVTRARSSLK